MYYVKNITPDGKEIHDPSINLAIEYHLLNNVRLDEPIVYFYINDNSIIVGKNQNTYDEVNLDYVEENDVKVVRRMSGGGAVYHDLGVLNFCFITKDDGESFRNFKRFTQPIIDVIQGMGGGDAHLEGRNDLVINGQKFSGNAMYSKDGRMTAHGTLMFNSEIDSVVGALKPNKYKLESKGIKSVRSRVTNIKPFLDEEYQTINTKEFREKILLSLFDVDDVEEVKEYKLTEEDWESVKEFANTYTGNWDWNYGSSPDFDVERGKRFEGIGTLDINFNVNKGKMAHVKIFGDFFGMGEIQDVEKQLEGIPYNRKDIEEALDKIDINHYIGDISAEELADLIY